MSTGKTLNQLVMHAQHLDRLLFESEGEITDEIAEILRGNEIKTPEKVEGYHFMMKRLEAEEAFYKARADEFARIAKARKNAREHLKENLKHCMEMLGVDEIEGIDYRFKLSNAKAKVVYEDENAIPKGYYDEVIVKKFHADKLREDLELGLDVPGVKLEPSKSLRPYPVAAKKLPAKSKRGA